jgi:hypothetical protein
LVSSARDFDFQIGSWHVRHRRLKERLVGCTEWEEFDGTSTMRPILGGNGNLEDNELEIASGTYRAIALRSFDPGRGLWAIWWLDGRAPLTLGVPVLGSFEDGVGRFFADDEQDGRAVRLRFLWLRTDTGMPRWEQAMSTDGGSSWETNWTMDFVRHQMSRG